MSDSQAPSPKARPFQDHVVPAILGPMGECVVEAARLSRGQRVLDVACGSGALTRVAAEAVGDAGSVVGADIDANMLIVAREETPHANVSWRQADATALPFADASFDVVLCGQGLQFVPDRALALREMRRVLAPGGGMTLGVWQGLAASPYFEAMHHALYPRVGSETAQTMRRAFAYDDAGQLRDLVAAAGFTSVEVEARVRSLRLPPLATFLGRHLAAIPVADDVIALGEEAVEEVIRDACSALGVDGDSAVELPFAIHVARGRA